MAVVWGEVRPCTETRFPRQSPRAKTGSSSPPMARERERLFPPVDRMTSSFPSPVSHAAEVPSRPLWLGAREHPSPSVSSDVFFNWPDTQACRPDQTVAFFLFSLFSCFLLSLRAFLPFSLSFPYPHFQGQVKIFKGPAMLKSL